MSRSIIMHDKYIFGYLGVWLINKKGFQIVVYVTKEYLRSKQFSHPIKSLDFM